MSDRSVRRPSAQADAVSSCNRRPASFDRWGPCRSRAYYVWVLQVCSGQPGVRSFFRPRTEVGQMLKRTLQATAIGYIVLGLGSRLMERRGILECGCDPDCWCKRPGLSLFRWVLPRWHKG